MRSVLKLGLFCGLVQLFLRYLVQRRRRLKARSLRAGVESMLLGVAVGDAFGAGIEFQDRDWIRTNIDFTKWVNKRGKYLTLNPYSSRNFFSGMYTDDCEMTLGLMRALTQEDPSQITCETLVQYWKREYQLSQQHFLSTRLWALLGVGRNGHGSILDFYEGKKTMQEIQGSQQKRTYPGNAPPMRALPLGFIKDDSLRIQLAILNADSTHPHPKARAASFLFAEATRHLMVKHAPFADIIRLCVESLVALEFSQLYACVYDEETVSYLRKVDCLPDYHDSFPKLEGCPDWLFGAQPIEWASSLRGQPIRGLDSSAMHTAGVVLYLLKWALSPLDALRHSMWVGGDVDSVGSLCLGLFGGAQGLQWGSSQGLPLWLLDTLEDVEGLLATAKTFQAKLVSPPAESG